MPKNRWDLKFNEISHAIKDLKTRVSAFTPKERISLTQKITQLTQHQATLSNILDQFKRITKGRGFLDPKSKAIIHWSQIIAEKTSKLYDLKSVNWCTNMWQQLIRERLIGNVNHQNLFIEDQDVLTMATRYNYIKKIEKQLSIQLTELRDKKMELLSQQKNLSTKISNMIAAQSMQNTSHNPKESYSKIAHNMLKDYLNWLTLPVRNHTSPEIKFQKDYLEAIRKTKNVLSSCRELATKQTVIDKKTEHSLMKNIHENLTDLEKFHAGLDASVNQIFKTPPPVVKPVIISTQSKLNIDPS